MIHQGGGKYVVGSDRLQNCLCWYCGRMGGAYGNGFYLRPKHWLDPLSLRKGGRMMDSTTLLSIGIIALICVGGIWLMEH